MRIGDVCVPENPKNEVKIFANILTPAHMLSLTIEYKNTIDSSR